MARKKADDAMVGLTLRLPEALRAKLSDEADASERSLNSEILYRLGQTFSEEWQQFLGKIEERQAREEELLAKAAQNPKLQEAIRKAIAEAIKEKPEEPPPPEEPIKRRKLP